MNKAVFLDRDGTINVDKHYLYKIKEFEFLPYAIEGLRILQQAGYLLIVITNQSGIARGYYTENDYHLLTEYMCSELERQDIHLADVFYCPHLSDARVKKYRYNCNCRKPELGLFYKAAKKWDIDFSYSWAIGDRERDCAICKKTACRGILLTNGLDVCANVLDGWEKSNSKLYISETLYSASRMIVQDKRKICF